MVDVEIEQVDVGDDAARWNLNGGCSGGSGEGQIFGGVAHVDDGWRGGPELLPVVRAQLPHQGRPVGRGYERVPAQPSEEDQQPDAEPMPIVCTHVSQHTRFRRRERPERN